MPTTTFGDLADATSDLIARIDPITPADRKLVEDEIKGSPEFSKKIKRILDRGGPHAVAESAKKAFLNELYQNEYPETAGEWPILRQSTRKLLVALPKAITEVVEATPLDEKLKIVEKIGQGKRLHFTLQDFPVESIEGLGQFEVVASIVSAVAGAGSAIYGAKVTADAQKAIAKIQADTQMKQLSLSMTLAKAQQAVASAQTAIIADVQAGKIPAGTGTTDPLPPGATPGSNIVNVKVPTGQITTTVKEPEGTFIDKKVGGIPLWGIALPLVGGLMLAFK